MASDTTTGDGISVLLDGALLQARSGTGSISCESLAASRKVTALFFSAMDAVGQYTPSATAQLMSYYSALRSKDAPFEVVYVSMDANKQDFGLHYETMPWLALPYDQRDTAERLVSRFKVKKGESKVVVLDSGGRLLNSRYLENVVLTDPGARAFPWPPPPERDDTNSDSDSDRENTDEPTARNDTDPVNLSDIQVKKKKDVTPGGCVCVPVSKGKDGAPSEEIAPSISDHGLRIVIAYVLSPPTRRPVNDDHSPSAPLGLTGDGDEELSPREALIGALACCCCCVVVVIVALFLLRGLFWILVWVFLPCIIAFMPYFLLTLFWVIVCAPFYISYLIIINTVWCCLMWPCMVLGCGCQCLSVGLKIAAGGDYSGGGTQPVVHLQDPLAQIV